MANEQLDNLFPGGIWYRSGSLFSIIKDNRNWQIVLAQAFTNDVLQHIQNNAAGINDLDQLPNFERLIYNQRQNRDAWTATIARQSRDIILETVDDVKTLPFTGDDTVIRTLIKLMNDYGDPVGTTPWTFLRPVITVDPEEPDANNQGDGHVIVDINTLEGEPFPYVRDERVDFDIEDLAGAGTFTKKGYPIRPDVQNYKWPGGSGAGRLIPACDPTLDATGTTAAAGSTLLINGNFENEDGSQFNNWPIDAGVYNTNLRQTADGEGLTGNTLELVTGEGRIKQPFDDSNGTPIRLTPRRKYCLSFFYKAAAAGPIGSGNFEVRFRMLGGDNEDATAPLEFSFTKALSDSDWPTTWRHGFAIINTPRFITGSGDDYAAYIGVAAGGSLSQAVFVDFVCMTEMIEDGNLWIAATRGPKKWELGDRVTVPITNNGPHGGGTDGLWQFYMDIAYDMWGRSNGSFEKIKFPDVVSGNTVDEAWIA